MKIKVLPKQTRKDIYKEAASLDDAHELGLFGSGMPFNEFCARILKPNPELRLHRSATHTGLFDTENNLFVCGISRLSRIPRFTILKRDKSLNKTVNYTDEDGNATATKTFNTDGEEGKVLSRSWISVFNSLKGQGYEINDKDIDY